MIVLDDLDRCPPTVALSIVEAIALLLDRDLSVGVVHSIALIEEDAFKASVLERYPRQLPIHAFEGHRDKLFDAYLRLPALDKDEFQRVVSFLFRWDEFNAAMASVELTKKAVRAKVAERESLSIALQSEKKQLKSGPPKTVRETRRRLRSGRPMRIGGPGWADFVAPEVDVEEIVHRPTTPAEQDEWRRKKQQEIDRTTKRLEEIPEEIAVAEQTAGDADAQVTSLAREIDDEASSIGARQRVPATPPSMSNEETKCLIDIIAKVAECHEGELVPRSARTIFRKYVLLRALWCVLHNSPNISETEWQKLGSAFLAALTNDESETVDNELMENRKLARYVV
jgi:hypothetical protein